VNGSRFIALGPLASGPTSRAFLGYETGAQGPAWPVVIIWVPDDISDDSDRIQQLKEDTERAAQIDHPNVIRVLGCELLDEGWARVVEFADAENLRSVFGAAAERALDIPVPILNRILADACAGVHHVHEMGQSEGNVRSRLHGALRPETLMVGFDGVTKVTGYGALAVAPRDVFGARLSPRLQYLSPEEIEGGPAAADRRSDIYSLGLNLYQGLCGSLPFAIQDPDFEQRVLAGDLDLDSLPRAPLPLREVVHKALQRNPGNRFPTAKSMQQVLESLGTADRAEVARFLARLLPEMNAERSDRRSLLSSVGLREPWPRAQARPRARRMRSAQPAITPAPGPVAPAPAPAPLQTPEVAPAAQVSAVEPTPAPHAASRIAVPVPPSPQPQQRPEPRPYVPPTVAAESSSKPWLYVVLGAVGVSVALLIAVVLWMGLGQPGLRRLASSVAAVASGDAPETVRLPPAPHPKVVPGPIAAVPPEPPPELPPAPAQAVLELSSQPRLQVWVDGQSKGMTPIEVSVAEGEHRLRFRDRAQGIDVGRTVYAHEGEHLKESVRMNAAAMELTAPAGSQITLDGRHVGSAPAVRTLHFFEGHHTIRVTMGHAVFERQFDAQAGETLTLDVHPEAVP
jgi:eukaryotic-like serine/threonine-protein kinase